MTPFDNYDDKEINKFDNVANIWWDLNGEMGTLHVINPLRTRFITEPLTVSSPAILDVGCGGGILAEALAKAGARVTGIDLSAASIAVARHHAQAQGLSIDYRVASAEEIAASRPESFDAVTCMEMLEHVPDPQKVVLACARALKPGGHAFFSTINRTLKAFLFAIIGGEYILRLLPRGTHTYRMLIRPDELKTWARQSGLEFVRIASLMYNPLRNTWKLAPDKADVNYIVHFIKR